LKNENSQTVGKTYKIKTSSEKRKKRRIEELSEGERYVEGAGIKE